MAREGKGRAFQGVGRLPRLPAAALLPALLLAAVAASAQPFDARAILTWQRFDADERSSEGLSQVYELGLTRSLSDAVRLRLFFGADFSDTSFESRLDSSAAGFDRLQGVGELRITYPGLNLRASYEGVGTRFEDEEAGDRDLQRGTAQLNWLPTGLPDLTLWADRRSSSEDLSGAERTETLLQATVFEERGPFRAAATVRSIELDEAFGGLRDTAEASGDLAFADSYWNGRLNTSARLFLLDSEIEERSAGPRVAVLEERLRLASVSTSIDESPEDARDEPPQPAAGLLDGLFLPVGLDLGPAGRSFLNVYLDPGRLVDMDRVLLYVRDGAGNVVETGGALDWSVWVSTDGLDWARLRAGVVSRFDPTRSLFEVSFPRLSTRLLKLVSFGLNIVDTQLVEVEAFETFALAPGETRRTDLRVGTADAALTARPTPKITVAWSGRWNRARRRPRDEPELRSDDNTQDASLAIEPAPKVKIVVRYHHRGERPSAGERRGSDQWTGILDLIPRPGTNFKLEVESGRNDIGGRELETEGLALRSHVRLLRAIDLRLDVGERRTRLPLDLEAVDTRFVEGWLIARLTDELQLTTSFRLVRDELESAPGAGDLAPSKDYRWWVEAFWRPGPPLAVTARLGNAEGDDFSADIRRLQIQWDPFRGGALNLGLAYDEDVDTSQRRTFRRLLVTPRWILNRHVSLDASYTIFDLSGAVSDRTSSLLASLTVRR